MGVEQCNHCYFWRKACQKKACYASHLTERIGWFLVRVVCVVLFPPPPPPPLILYRAEFTVKDSPEC